MAVPGDGISRAERELGASCHVLLAPSAASQLVALPGFSDEGGAPEFKDGVFEDVVFDNNSHYMV